MEYEKKYKEALERARALRNEAIEKEYAVDYIKDYETIFPELAESEDERIRKDIVALIEFGLTEGSAVSPGSHTTKEEALVWLEKQREREHLVMSVLSNDRIYKAIEIFPDECDCKVGDVIKAIIKKD